jgi:hypothetical protein
LGRINRDRQPGKNVALTDHVVHPLRAQVAIFVGRLQFGGL